MHKRNNKSRGFTLVEVLIALVIAAIALSAVARTVMQATDTTILLRDRQVALWVAQNLMAETQLASSWPALDTTNGTEEMGGKQWFWTKEVISTPEPMLRRVKIVIRDELESRQNVSLVHFFRTPGRVSQ